MASFFRESVQRFLSTYHSDLLARLESAYARHYSKQFTSQIVTWEKDISLLQTSLAECAARSTSALKWQILLEFSIPRKERRIDVVLLVRDSIVVLETKSGLIDAAARSQVEEYARLLYYFHKGSTDRRIFPLMIGSSVPDVAAFVAELPTSAVSIKNWISVATEISWQRLPDTLLKIQRISRPVQLNASDWDESPYFPVPNILAAAVALRTGLKIREIAHSEASEIEIEACGKRFKTMPIVRERSSVTQFAF
jgi:hypothetical protein